MPIKEKIISHNAHYFTREKTFEELPYQNTKAHRQEELYIQRVTVGEHTYDAGEKSMDRIDRVLTLANAKMNAALSQGLTHPQAYKLVYKDTPVPWKMANNEIHIVDAETLMQVQDAAMEGMKQIWLRYG